MPDWWKSLVLGGRFRETIGSVPTAPLVAGRTELRVHILDSAYRPWIFGSPYRPLVALELAFHAATTFQSLTFHLQRGSVVALSALLRDRRDDAVACMRRWTAVPLRNRIDVEHGSGVNNDHVRLLMVASGFLTYQRSRADIDASGATLLTKLLEVALTRLDLPRAA